MAPRLLTFAGAVPGLGGLARRCARLYRENSVVAVRSSPAAEFLWRRHHRYVNGYWLGHYETAVREALARELTPGDAFFDIGAHAGFFTLVGARAVGSTGLCVAIDPLPENHEAIREQVRLNGLTQCRTLNVAIADFTGKAILSSSAAGSSTAHLGSAGAGETEIEVPVTTVDQVCALFGRPSLIKLDVEGAEARVLQGAAYTLRTLRPSWIIELHGPACEQDVKSRLVDARYDFLDLRARPLAPDEDLPRHFLARPRQNSE